METSIQRNEVTKAIFDLGVPGSNEERVLLLLIHASKKNELGQLISIANRLFFEFSCIQNLIAAAAIQKEIGLHSEEEVWQAVEFIKSRVSPDQFQKV